MKEKTNILIVEKEGIIAKDIERILVKFGYNVPAVVFSGFEALQKAEEFKPDLILSEIALGGTMDGIETAYRIYSTLNIPVVFLTASSDNKTIERVKKINPYGFIIKPFGEELLHATIETAIYRHRMENANNEEKSGLTLKVDTMQKTSEAGLQDGWTRATFIVKKDQLEKIKALAYWDRKKVKDVVGEAIGEYLGKREILPVVSEKN